MTVTGRPTKEVLIEATLALLETKDPSDIQVGDLREATGVSVGSMYHHFENLDGLVEAALLRRFTAFVDASIASMQRIFSEASSSDDVARGLRAVTRATQAPGRAPDRLHRAQTMAAAARDLDFGTKVATEQQRMTDAIAAVAAGAQQRGWVRPELDPVAVAVLVQAYTFGRIVDDVSLEHVDPEGWFAIIDTLIERVIIAGA